MAQYGSILLLGLMLVLFPPRDDRNSDLLWATLFYGLAKMAEAFDSAIFSVGGLVSGHTLKHLLAAAAIYCVLRMLARRTALPEQSAVSPGARLSQPQQPRRVEPAEQT